MNTKLIGIGIIAALSILVVFFGAMKFDLLNFPFEEEEPGFDFEVWNIVTSYNGDNGQGQTILDLVKVKNNEMYEDPNILLQGSSFVEWRSFKEPSLGEDVYIVDFYIETVQETREYIWHYDKSTGEITSGNEAAQILMEQVNSD